MEMHSLQRRARSCPNSSASSSWEAFRSHPKRFLQIPNRDGGILGFVRPLRRPSLVTSAHCPLPPVYTLASYPWSGVDNRAKLSDPRVVLIDIADLELEGVPPRKVRFAFFDGTLFSVQARLSQLVDSPNLPALPVLGRRENHRLENIVDG